LKGVNNAKKNIVQLVYRKKLFYTAKQVQSVNGLSVVSVKKLLYGSGHTIKLIKKNTGLIFG